MGTSQVPGDFWSSFLAVTGDAPKSTHNTTKPTRMILQPSEVLRLSQHSQTVRVIAGYAWLTQHKADIILLAGQQFHARAQRSPVLITAERHLPLVLEISKH